MFQIKSVVSLYSDWGDIEVIIGIIFLIIINYHILQLTFCIPLTSTGNSIDFSQLQPQDDLEDISAKKYLMLIKSVLTNLF